MRMPCCDTKTMLVEYDHNDLYWKIIEFQDEYLPQWDKIHFCPFCGIRLIQLYSVKTKSTTITQKDNDDQQK